MILYRTPGRSFTRPPRTSTIECSWRLWPPPGMYAVTSIWFVRRTRHTLRSAEFGFFGVVVYTRVHTPRFCGAATFFLRPLPDFRPGVASFLVFGVRPLRTSWEVVGMRSGQDSSGPWRSLGASEHRSGPGDGRVRHLVAGEIGGRGVRRPLHRAAAHRRRRDAALRRRAERHRHRRPVLHHRRGERRAGGGHVVAAEGQGIGERDAGGVV